MAEIILASTSPRRRELMELIGRPFNVVTKEVEEIMDSTISPADNVQNLALKKARSIACDYKEAIVIGCDTIVALNQVIIGKPRNTEEAFNILQTLSGKEHQVYTGVAIVHEASHRIQHFYQMTQVTMKKLTAEEINRYIATGEPLDKAGAYGIQGKGAIYIEKIIGDYYTVMGLPVCKLYKELNALCNSIE